MWFTKVSLKNPVFATMVMLAIVVLGLFSYQRLQVDQFPNIDFPVVVITTDYPGASPEIVESEVTKKVEEGVNSIAGINALTSRSYEGQSVVIIEFQLYIDGRKAADDVREKIGIIRPTFRDPRTHFALVCASTSCPKLRQEAYVGSRLDDQLDDQARRFLSDPSRNRIDPATGTLELSAIFNWFKEDFTRDGRTLADFLAPYLTPQQVQLLHSTPPKYLDYDWTMNAQPGQRPE